MKKNILTFGLVLGILLTINMVYMVNLCMNDPDFKGNDVVGYTIHIVVFSLTFFGILNYRNKELNGFISFGKAFKTGAFIALVGSTLYVVVWLFYYYLFVPEFLDKYIEHVMIEANRNGSTASEIEATQQQMQQYRQMYQNPLFVILMTFAEVLPIGLIVAFISSLILRKKQSSL